MRLPIGRGRVTPQPEADRRRFIFCLFGLPFLVYLLFGPTFLGYDGDIMLRVSQSLVFHGSVRITDPMAHFNQPYSIYGIAVSVLLVPFVLAGHWLGRPDLWLTLYEPAVTALTVVVVALLVVELGKSWQMAVWTALLYAFGTLAWQYSGVLFSEPLLALCVAVGLLGGLRFRHRGQRRWLLVAGAAAGVAVTARLDSAVDVALPLMIYVLTISRRGTSLKQKTLVAVWYGLPVGIGLLIDAGYNLVRFGSPFRSGYLIDTLGFSTPLLKGLYGLLFSPGVGLLVFVPVVIVTLLGWPEFWRTHRAEGLVVLAVSLSRLVIFAGWWSWDGGMSWGPRFLVPVLPVLILPVAFLPRRGWIRIAALPLVAASVGVELLGQLVWYGTYVGRVVPGLTAQVLASGRGCTDCGFVRESLTTQAVKEIMDFSLVDSPLWGQLQLLLGGHLDPRWATLVWVLPPIGLLAGLMFAGLLRSARRLDVRPEAGLESLAS